MRGEGRGIVRGTEGRVVTLGREGNGTTQKREGIAIVQRRETAREKGGEKGIIREMMAPIEERGSVQGRERTVGKETMAETTDPTTGTGAAASLPRGAVREAGVPGGETVATIGGDNALATLHKLWVLATPNNCTLFLGSHRLGVKWVCAHTTCTCESMHTYTLIQLSIAL